MVVALFGVSVRPVQPETGRKFRHLHLIRAMGQSIRTVRIKYIKRRGREYIQKISITSVPNRVQQIRIMYPESKQRPYACRQSG